jgi:hypothetical protein
VPGGDGAATAADRRLETAFCAEIVAATYQAMGLLPGGRRPNWYDPGRFWSGDDLELTGGFELGGEISVRLPVPPADQDLPVAGAAVPTATVGLARHTARLRTALREQAGRLERLRNR